MLSDDSRTARGLSLRRRPLLCVCLALALSTALTACGDSALRPLYATTPAGEHVHERMKEVDFAPIPGRVGQRIRNDLVFQSTGGGHPLPPQFRFEVVLQENVVSTIVSVSGQNAGRPSGAVYSIHASFRLIDIRSKQVVFQGASHARAAFERFESTYSGVRAREDAENRAARTIAEDLKTRLAAYLSRPPAS
jgi:LPS-assembly lipoprotein